MTYPTAINNGTLLHNGICCGIALIVLLLLTQALLRGGLRLSNLFLRAKFLAIPPNSQLPQDGAPTLLQKKQPK